MQIGADTQLAYIREPRDTPDGSFRLGHWSSCKIFLTCFLA